MTIYCDTSFLISWFYSDDSRHKTARAVTAKYDGEDFVLCEVHQLEFPAAVRAAVHRAELPLPRHLARALINRFDRAWNGRDFIRRQLPLDSSIAMARSLGEAHGWSKRHTAFDLWHLAAAWCLGAGAFLTFDERQKEVSRILSFRTD